MEIKKVKDLLEAIPHLEQVADVMDQDFINMDIICRDPDCKAYNTISAHIAFEKNKGILVFDLK